MRGRRGRRPAGGGSRRRSRPGAARLTPVLAGSSACLTCTPDGSSTGRSGGPGPALLPWGPGRWPSLAGRRSGPASGDAIAGDVGLSGVLFGATVLAAAISLPELSTGIASVRHGDFQLAVSDIFGGNAFLPVLFLLPAWCPAPPCSPASGAGGERRLQPRRGPDGGQRRTQAEPDETWRWATSTAVSTAAEVRKHPAQAAACCRAASLPAR
ncbi:sodium/calcium exchanger protein [Georgenia sp. SYP-B2076]|uniref:sodium/calcium exchanger protein n=1 Tax=Georgenia sp. SYP-B2076 TaxID=2495881 RepID=UPI001F0BF29A|nr:sodium/calcium exchanger protein [Georgenia sp. SYP-B2076]